MKRNTRDNRSAPTPPPVKHIELNPKNWKLRVALVAGLLAIGIFFIGSGIYQALAKDPGWRQIQPSSKDSDSCAQRFTLYYDLGSSGASASLDFRTVTAEFTESAAKAYKLFNADKGYEGMNNLFTLSTNPNVEFAVDPALYRALALLKTSGTRTVFLAPMYEQYYSLFASVEDSEAADFDPAFNEELASFYEDVCRFANDPGHIYLELLEGSKAKLVVSQEYMAFAKQEQITSFLDLGWLEQAFQADFIADALIASGHTHATLSGDMGYSRVLDDREATYYTNILDYAGSRTYGVGRVRQAGPYAGVSLRDYPVAGGPMTAYAYADGTLRSVFVSPEDGRNHTAAHDLLAYSAARSCGEIALQLAPIFLTEELDVEALNGLRSNGIYSVFCREKQICYNQEGVAIEDVLVSNTVSYTKHYIG